jgi:uncharacterized protein YbaP (TraB family)
MKTLLRSFAALLAWIALPAWAETSLWEVVSITNRAYLFGTVHAGKASWYPLPQVVESAFHESNVLVVEADITDVNALSKSANSMTYAPPDSLRRHVPADEYERYRKLLARYTIPEEAVAQSKPFLAVSLLVFSEWARAGFVPQHGVDAYLIAKAKAELKPVVEIEGVEMQVRLMESLTDEENRTIFSGTLAALEGGVTSDQINGMVEAWQKGDGKQLLEVARRYNDTVAGAKDIEEKFVWSRHEDMLKKIDGYLASKDRHFIAVGALHLVGERGLVEQLRKRGYIVRQR